MVESSIGGKSKELATGSNNIFSGKVIPKAWITNF
jgi:hypothetical protein